MRIWRMKKNEVIDMTEGMANVDKLAIRLSSDISEFAEKCDIHIGMLRQHMDSMCNWIKANCPETGDIVVRSVLCASMDELMVSAHEAGYEINKSEIMDLWFSAPIGDEFEGWDD